MLLLLLRAARAGTTHFTLIGRSAFSQPAQFNLVKQWWLWRRRELLFRILVSSILLIVPLSLFLFLPFNNPRDQGDLIHKLKSQSSQLWLSRSVVLASCFCFNFRELYFFQQLAACLGVCLACLLLDLHAFSVMDQGSITTRIANELTSVNQCSLSQFSLAKHSLHRDRSPTNVSHISFFFGIFSAHWQSESKLKQCRERARRRENFIFNLPEQKMAELTASSLELQQFGAGSNI